MDQISSMIDARMKLNEIMLDVAADQGEDMVEAGYLDLVRVVADMCTPAVAAELLRQEGIEA